MIEKVGLGWMSIAFVIAVAALCSEQRVLAQPCEPEWHPFFGGHIGVGGSGFLNIEAMAVWNGDLFAGGQFTTAGGETVNNIARWDGSKWHPLASGGQVGVDGTVYALKVWDGDLIVGGSFNTAGGQTVNRIARWDGSMWHPLISNGEIGTLIGSVRALTVWNGDLVAGGHNFAVSSSEPGELFVYSVARWNGSGWFHFGGATALMRPTPTVPTHADVSALTVWNDDLIVGGNVIWAGGQTVNRIARWSGTEWLPFTSGGEIGLNGESAVSRVEAVVVWNGDLIAGGHFTSAGGQTVNYVSRWDGKAWHPLASGGEIGVSGDHPVVVRTLAAWNGDLIAGGSFATAGGQTVNGIARWDGSAWHPVSSAGQAGANSVYALTVWHEDLIAGGIFTSAGGQTVNRIARWDGLTWHRFHVPGGGPVGVSASSNPTVLAMTEWNGDLVAGGSFGSAGGQTANGIARWDGSAWHPFSSGGQIGTTGARTLTVWNGDLIAGGTFATAGGQNVNGIARWDGNAWHPFTSGGQAGVNGHVYALEVWNGDLVAGGHFTMAGGQTVNNIARWDGSAWHPLIDAGQTGVSERVYSLAVWNGDLIAGGLFTTAGGQTVDRIARWDGSAWHPFASGGQVGVSGAVWALTVWNSDLVATCGNTAGGQTVNRIARWDGLEWHPFASGGQVGVDGNLWALWVWNGDLIAGGFFSTAGGQTVNRIARWDGSAWHALASGEHIGVDSSVESLTVWNGDLIAGGYFNTAGGQTVNRIARWNGCDAPTCTGDLNSDGVVDVSDLLILLGTWGACPETPGCPADLNGDTVVDVSDLLILLAVWGACP